jgi:hypothetical protein
MIYEHAELRIHPGAGPRLEAAFPAAQHLQYMYCSRHRVSIGRADP